MTCVPHAGYYFPYLWRFDTYKRGWERVDNTAANGAAPSGRASHVLISVGLDLWLHGGTGDTYSGEGDARRCCCCCAEAESVILCTFSDFVSCGLCTDHDLCDACRLFHRAVAVRHPHARVEASRDRCWPRHKKKSRDHLRRAGPVDVWWRSWCFR